MTAPDAPDSTPRPDEDQPEATGPVDAVQTAVTSAGAYVSRLGRAFRRGVDDARSEG